MHDLCALCFQFLAEDVMGYIEDWKKSVMVREGFSRSEKNKMFLSQQTYDGMKSTGIGSWLNPNISIWQDYLIEHTCM